MFGCGLIIFDPVPFDIEIFVSFYRKKGEKVKERKKNKKKKVNK